MADVGSIRVHGETYERLKNLRREGESVEDVVERLLDVEIEGEVIERPEEETVGVTVDKSLVEEVNSRAGENVNANDVIEALINQHEGDET